MAYNQTFSYLPNVGYLLVDGSVNPSSSYRYSDHIPVVSGAGYRMANTGTTPSTIATCYYDVNGDFIAGFLKSSTYAPLDSVAPTNARTAKFSMKKDYDMTVTQLTKLDENPTPIEPEPEPVPTYDYVITQSDLDYFAVDKVNLFSNGVVVGVDSGLDIGDSLEFRPDAGWLIVSISYRDADGYNSNFDVSNDGLSATKTYDGVDVQDYSIYTEIAAATPDFVWTQVDIDDFTVNGVVMFVNDVAIVDGSQMFDNDVMKLVADDGYNIESVTWRDNDGFSYSFTIADDEKTATKVYKVNDGMSSLTVSTRYAQQPDIVGYNDVYRVTDSQMRDVATESFKFFDGQTTVDYGTYIIGAIDLPFELKESQIVGYQNIALGDSTTDINAELLTTDTIRVDMGTVTAPTVNDNLLDFTNTVAVLHLPYIESVTIDIDYVMGESVSIEYLISLYDGLAIVNLYSTKTGGLINTRNVDLNVTIPFGNIDSNPSKNDPKNVELGGDNGVRTPRLEIMRNDAVLPYGFFTIPIVDESLLSNQYGYVVVDDIELITVATSAEKAEIESLLTNGVIIK